MIKQKQTEDFPETFYGIVISEKNKDTLSFYDYELGFCITIPLKIRIKFPYYIALVPRCIDDNLQAVHSLIVTDYDLQVGATVRLVPIYLLVIPEIYSKIHHLLVSVPVFDKKEVDLDHLKETLSYAFRIKKDDIFIEKENKAKAFLVHTHKNYELGRI